MNGGGKFLAAAAGLAIAACANSGKLELRPTPNRTAADNAPLPQKLAEGYAQLKLGNPGLASELFRQSLRGDPASAEANVGLAASYDQMGRFDLSRRYFETALAIRPADTQLLERFAASLDRQGARADATAVRGEIAARLAQLDKAETRTFVAAVAPVEPAATFADGPASPTIVAMAAPVLLAPSAPTPAATPRQVTAPAPVVATVAKASSAAVPAPIVPVSAAIKRHSAPTPARIMPPPAAEPTPVAQVAAASVTVQLPPARPAPKPVQVAAASAPKSPPIATDASQAAPSVQIRADPRRFNSPSLQRLSLAEVALVTTGVSRWRPQVVAQTGQSTTIRFVPLKKPQQVFPGVRLLNAARSQGLAAHTRTYLSAKGWRRLSIGDADQTRETSIILYPESRRRTAEILAAQFRIRVAKRAGNDQAIVMLLGRDAARLKANRTSA